MALSKRIINIMTLLGDRGLGFVLSGWRNFYGPRLFTSPHFGQACENRPAEDH